MSGSFFSYELPRDRIAQVPARGLGRDAAKLLYFRNGEICDLAVKQLAQLLLPGDLLVLNNSQVLPCRFFFEHLGTTCELLLAVRSFDTDNRWEALARPMKRFKAGDQLKLGPSLRAKVLGRSLDFSRLVLDLTVEGAKSSVSEAILKEGSMPLPPYIKQGKADLVDNETYQTIFASQPGSVAAPTAGLHFSDEIFSALAAKGVDTMQLTLHVGPASFQPVSLEAIKSGEHKMPEELYSFDAEKFELITKAKKDGRRIVAVGTTSARTLETVARLGVSGTSADLKPTSLFITPGFDFQWVDLLMTNFHQPNTTHLLLVAAFIGEAATERIYQHALKGSYMFLSYGDTMLLERGRC